MIPLRENLNICQMSKLKKWHDLPVSLLCKYDVVENVSYKLPDLFRPFNVGNMCLSQLSIALILQHQLEKEAYT